MFGSMAKDGERAEERVAFINPRFFSPMLLVAGSIFCLFGFVFVTGLGVYEFFVVKGNPDLGVVYASGNGYFPSTISEMVHNHSSPLGKIFNTFALLAALCIFMSFYPYCLRNAYTGTEKAPIIGWYWTTVRQIFPAMGLLLLAGVNTYPGPVAAASPGKIKLVCKFLHLVGAGMMFCGFMVCELSTLAMLKIPGVADGQFQNHLARGEAGTRKLLGAITTFFYFLFCGVQIALVVGGKSIGSGDVWTEPGQAWNHGVTGIARVLDTPQIVNTASGTYLVLKIVSSFSEVIAAVAIVSSHFAIWYYCNERQIEYGHCKLERLVNVEADYDYEFQDEDDEEDDA